MSAISISNKIILGRPGHGSSIRWPPPPDLSGADRPLIRVSKSDADPAAFSKDVVPSRLLNGQRVCLEEDGPIFLVMGGLMRWIPDESTYLGLFGEQWARYLVSPSRIFFGLELLPGTSLIAAPDKPDIYLVDLGKRRRIAQSSIMERYSFPWNRVRIVPQRTLAAVAEGPPIVEDWL